MALTVNQILVICLIIVLIGFLVVFAKMGVSALDLMKTVKRLVNNSNELVDGTKATVQNVGDSITSTATQLVADSDTTTKVVTVTASGIIAVSFVSGLFQHLIGKKSKRAKRQLKRSEKELKAAEKAARRARKIQRKAGKVARIGF